MKPNFWKLSQGAIHFQYKDIIESIAHGLVYVHKDTLPKATRDSSQGEDFINAPIGDYFYLTYGNKGIFLLGQFSGPANLFSKYGEGWLERPYKFIAPAIKNDIYSGEHKWWSPTDNSTFIKVKETDFGLFEKEILHPYFDIKFSEFSIDL